jgi:hypothetical protein
MEMGGMSADDMAQAFDQSVKALNSVSYVLDRFGFSKTAEDVLIALNNLVVEAGEKEEDDEDEDEKKDEKDEKDEKKDKKDEKDDEGDAKGKADREEDEEKEGKTHSHSLPAKEHTHEGDKKSTEKDESVTEVDTKHTHPELSFKKKEDKGDARENPEMEAMRSMFESEEGMKQEDPVMFGESFNLPEQQSSTSENVTIDASRLAQLLQAASQGAPIQELMQRLQATQEAIRPSSSGPQTAGGGPASGQPLPGFEGEGDNASDGTYSAFASMLSAEHDRHMGFVRVAKAKGKDKGKEDPKAKVRNRGAVCVPAEKAKDNKDHFPINSEAQARNALARVNQFDKAPPWWSGSLQSLVNTVAKAVKSKYKGIEVSKKSTKPKKGSMESLLVALGSDRY